MTEPTTRTLDVPDVVLHYDVRKVESGTAPTLLMIGSPMDASGFTSLAEHFPDRTVVTYDPRGAGRSTRTDGVEESTPELHADDLHRLISALDAASTRIVIGVGAESAGEMAHRTGQAIADRLGTTKAVTFPSHHGGFLGEVFGMKGEPAAFAVVLHRIRTEQG